MCDHDEDRAFDRRDLLALAGLGTGCSRARACAARPPRRRTQGTSLDGGPGAGGPEGRQRALRCPIRRSASCRSCKQRAEVADSQAPWATIVGCSDSRVPPELLFGGLGLGQLFVARNAGNMVDTATMGTIEYGAEHLGAPLVVVLGHERCGAVVAACEVVTKNAKLAGLHRPHGQADRAGRMAMTRQARRFRRQHRARERQADGRRRLPPARSWSHCQGDEAQGRRRALRPRRRQGRVPDLRLRVAGARESAPHDLLPLGRRCPKGG